MIIFTIKYCWSTYLNEFHLFYITKKNNSKTFKSKCTRKPKRKKNWFFFFKRWKKTEEHVFMVKQLNVKYFEKVQRVFVYHFFRWWLRWCLFESVSYKLYTYETWIDVFIFTGCPPYVTMLKPHLSYKVTVYKRFSAHKWMNQSRWFSIKCF